MTEEEVEEYPFIRYDEEPDAPTQTADIKYEVEAQIPKEQEKNLAPYSPFYGRHVALGNTERLDNARHLDAYDSVTIFDRCPTLRHLATELRGREVSEFQMCRSNPELGGFERKMRSTSIRRDSMRVRELKEGRKKGMFDFLKGRSKNEIREI